MHAPMDHDLRIWVDAQTFLAVQAAAAADNRSVSGYVRVLILADLSRKASAMAAQSDRDTMGAVRPEPVRNP